MVSFKLRPLTACISTSCSTSLGIKASPFKSGRRVYLAEASSPLLTNAFFVIEYRQFHLLSLTTVRRTLVPRLLFDIHLPAGTGRLPALYLSGRTDLYLLKRNMEMAMHPPFGGLEVRFILGSIPLKSNENGRFRCKSTRPNLRLDTVRNMFPTASAVRAAPST